MTTTPTTRTLSVLYVRTFSWGAGDGYKSSRSGRSIGHFFFPFPLFFMSVWMSVCVTWSLDAGATISPEGKKKFLNQSTSFLWCHNSLSSFFLSIFIIEWVLLLHSAIAEPSVNVNHIFSAGGEKENGRKRKKNPLFFVFVVVLFSLSLFCFCFYGLVYMHTHTSRKVGIII